MIFRVSDAVDNYNDTYERFWAHFATGSSGHLAGVCSATQSEKAGANGTDCAHRRLLVRTWRHKDINPDGTRTTDGEETARTEESSYLCEPDWLREQD